MKKKLFTLVALITIFGCKAQDINIIDVKDDINLNYVLANIDVDSIIFKDLWNGTQYIKVYKIKDSKATKKDDFADYDGTLESLYVSALPDGDYYSNSVLYKVEGLLNPKVLGIKEGANLTFIITIEHGSVKNRKTKSLVFKGTM